MGNLLQILMMLTPLIQGVEKIIPQSGQGPAKLEIVKSIVSSAVPPQQQPQVMPQIEQFVSLIVMFLNIAKAFQAAVPGPTPVPQSITMPPPATGTITGTVYAEQGSPSTTVHPWPGASSPSMIDVFDPKLPSNSAAAPVPLPQQVAEAAQTPRPFP